MDPYNAEWVEQRKLKPGCTELEKINGKEGIVDSEHIILQERCLKQWVEMAYVHVLRRDGMQFLSCILDSRFLIILK